MASKSKSSRSKASQAVEKSNLFPRGIPEEVTQCIATISLIEASQLQNIIKLVIMYLVEKEIPGKYDDILQKLSLPENADLSILLSGVYTVISTIIRLKSSADAIRADLTKLNMPDDASSLILRATQAQREKLELSAAQSQIRLPKLQTLRWRVDVVISSGTLSRVMKPTILMQIKLKNGTTKTFEVSVEQFNQLRYGVAKMLNDMHTLARHPIMRIVSEFERRDIEERRKK